jgi:flagellar basal-body rod modification protein FlgD
MSTIPGTASHFRALDSSLTTASSGSSSAQTTNSADLGQAEFMQLLIAQLQNQDPEAPVDSKEFAVQLAQFTQVEQLIKINDKLDAQNDLSSLASYLGHEVTLDGSSVAVVGGDVGNVEIDLQGNASDVRVELLNTEGEVVGTASLGAMQAGKHPVTVEGVSVPDGNYEVRVIGESASGTGSFRAGVSISGLVTGVVPGADPKLIVDGKEIRLGEIKALKLAQPTSQEAPQQ